MIPVRCFSCGKVISSVYEEYKKRLDTEEPGKILDDLGVDRYCCRRMILTHVGMVDLLAPYQ